MTLPLLFLAAGLAVTVLWLSSRYAWWVPTVDYVHPRILMYHMIDEPRRHHKFRGLRVSPSMFDRQLHWLVSDGWKFVTVSELHRHRHRLPPKTVAITFDDGFLDNYTQALPLLKKYNACATLYLVLNRHDNDWQVRRKAHHDSGEIRRVPKLQDNHVREMIDSGLFELGGHTINHVNLAQESRAVKEREICHGRCELQQQFETPIESFAYPFGIFGEEDVEIVAAAGYTSAVTVSEGIDTSPACYELKRIKVSGKDSLTDFKTRLRVGRRGRI